MWRHGRQMGKKNTDIPWIEGRQIKNVLLLSRCADRWLVYGNLDTDYGDATKYRNNQECLIGCFMC